MKSLLTITLCLILQSLSIPLVFAQAVDYSHCPACTTQDIQLLIDVNTKYQGVQGNNPTAPSTYGLIGINKFSRYWEFGHPVGGVFDTFAGDNWLPIRREKQNFCGRLDSFGIARYGDENDWNIHLIPNQGFEDFIAELGNTICASGKRTYVWSGEDGPAW